MFLREGSLPICYFVAALGFSTCSINHCSVPQKPCPRVLTAVDVDTTSVFAGNGEVLSTSAIVSEGEIDVNMLPAP